MAQKISQGNIFGRIGTGFGKGLAEQIPKEIERNRLATGLNALQNESANLSPQEYFTKALQVPGLIDRPQAVQSLAELARFQNQARAFQNSAGGQPNQVPRSSPDLTDIQSRRILDQAQPQQLQSVQQTAQAGQRTPNAPRDETIPEIAPIGVNANTLPRLPWTPQQRDARISEYIGMNFLPDMARTLAADDEARDLAEPTAYKAREEELKSKSLEARNEFKRQLETKLQKNNEGVFKDITGEMLINMERGLERDLITKPNSSYKDVANDWSNRALSLAKAKNQLNEEAQTTGFETWFKGNEAYNKLKNYSDIYRKADNSEELYNTLQLKDGFGLSPQAAASIAFPLSKPLSNFIDRYKTSFLDLSAGQNLRPGQREADARKAAIELADSGYLGDPNASILAIARELSQNNSNFDQQAFFDQLSQDKERIGLNPRQQRELAKGKPGIIPYWGDILIMPRGRTR